MKTNIFITKASLYSLIGFLSVLITSCGSYQNSSYYGDGIYGDQTNTQDELLRIVITDTAIMLIAKRQSIY
jgi:hypothetical protein